MTNPTTSIKRIEDYGYDTYFTSYDCPYETFSHLQMKIFMVGNIIFLTPTLSENLTMTI